VSDERGPDCCTCGTCGHTWDYNENPTPAHRCPMEADHEPEPDVPDTLYVILQISRKTGTRWTDVRALGVWDNDVSAWLYCEGMPGWDQMDEPIHYRVVPMVPLNTPSRWRREAVAS